MKKQLDTYLLAVYDTVSGNLKRLRGAMRQEDFAKQAGVSRETISGIENKKPFSLATLIKIAKGLGINPGDLFLTDDDRAEVTYKAKKVIDQITRDLKTAGN